MREYQIIGRKLPTEKEPKPQLYRMRIFAPSQIIAKSRFWYFLTKLRKVKKTGSEIVTVNEIIEKKPTTVKNYGIWIRYDSRSGTHNMYKEYRDCSRAAAVESCYQDLAARHRARFRSIQIIRVTELAAKDVKRSYVRQFINSKIKFPLPHHVRRPGVKRHRSLLIASRPSTFY
ncbi:60S ribosomal protein L20-B [Smittium mucronatum]|uniref:60S ribosomal protein L20 n=1 Tax=Smittium mucronatum TaxID=133383 RepID=A0A1R0GRB1_9FUNG|nr:60S ribosomal protein L20-B [Smittium mucronatum]